MQNCNTRPSPARSSRRPPAYHQEDPVSRVVAAVLDPGPSSRDAGVRPIDQGLKQNTKVKKKSLYHVGNWSSSSAMIFMFSKFSEHGSTPFASLLLWRQYRPCTSGIQWEVLRLTEMTFCQLQFSLSHWQSIADCKKATGSSYLSPRVGGLTLGDGLETTKLVVKGPPNRSSCIDHSESVPMQLDRSAS